MGKMLLNLLRLGAQRHKDIGKRPWEPLGFVGADQGTRKEPPSPW